jgi:hypothetical protein
VCVLAQVILENAKALLRAGAACRSRVAGDESSSKVAGETSDHFACSRLPVSADFHVVDAAR